MPISTVNINKSKHLQDNYGSYQYLCVVISISLSLQESCHLPPSTLSLVGEDTRILSARLLFPAFLLFLSLPLGSFSPFSRFTHLL